MYKNGYLLNAFCTFPMHFDPSHSSLVRYSMTFLLSYLHFFAVFLNFTRLLCCISSTIVMITIMVITWEQLHFEYWPHLDSLDSLCLENGCPLGGLHLWPKHLESTSSAGLSRPQRLEPKTLLIAREELNFHGCIHRRLKKEVSRDKHRLFRNLWLH